MTPRPPQPGHGLLPPRLKWRQKLAVRLNLALLLVVLAATGVFSLVVLTQGQDLLSTESDKLETKTAESVLLALRERLARAETIATLEKNQMLAFTNQLAALQTTLPMFLNPKGYGNLIAGGGVWPEPGVFTPGVERQSLFWGRDQLGKLQFYNDYNDPKGPGYHHEEWYVPARHSSDDRCYWSRSYMDPYSFEPMTTCTIAARKGRAFLGVATVDLKLNGLKEFLAEATEDTGGYAIALDRENRFLAFPDLSKAREMTKDASGKPVQRFLLAEELGAREKDFYPIVKMLDGANTMLVNRSLAAAGKSRLEGLARDIASSSYQIDPAQAKVIAAYLLRPADLASPFIPAAHQLTLKSDLLLKEPVHVTVQIMPSAWWKIVIVTPLSRSRQFADTILRWFYGVNLLFLLAGMGCLSLMLHWSFIGPLASLVNHLRKMSEKGIGPLQLLTVPGDTELGQLAWAFNQRTQELDGALSALEEANATLEGRVVERTLELAVSKKALEVSNQELQKEMEDRKKLEEDRQRMQNELLDVSRRAGMAQVATGVLHNVGNVLNNLNVSLTVLEDRVRRRKTDNLMKAVDTLKEHRDVMEKAMGDSERARNLFTWLDKMALALAKEREENLQELAHLGQCVDHMKKIVTEQQSYARVSGLVQTVPLQEVVDYAMSITDAGFSRHGVHLVKEFEPLEPMLLEKEKALQILINLLSNAKYALEDVPREERTITVRVYADGPDAVVEVEDNGQGIDPGNLIQIFTLGFTTREDGHGFGLHTSALAAAELGGSLKAHSDGPGKGARFTLRLPYTRPGHGFTMGGPIS